MRYEFEVYNNWKYIKNADTMSTGKKIMEEGEFKI